jgi:hypothetical protein
VVKLAAGAPAGLVVAVAGASVADPTLPVPLPVDPGKFTATASAPGYKPWSHGFNAVEGKVTSIEIPVLVAAPVAPTPPTSTTSTSSTSAGVPVAPVQPLRLIEGDNGTRHTRHVIGATTVVVGLAALGAGAYFGSVARSKWSNAKSICNGDVTTCSSGLVQPAQAEIDDARSAARLSTLGFAAGGAAVVIGAIVWFSAPAAEHRLAMSPAIGSHSTGLALSGSF